MKKRFRLWLSRWVPFERPGRLSFRGRDWVPWSVYEADVQSRELVISKLQTEQEILTAKLQVERAYQDKLKAEQANAGLVNESLRARLDRAEARYESACIILHLQRQKQVAYEKSVYAASMGGFILDNQNEIAQIAAAVAKEIKQIK